MLPPFRSQAPPAKGRSSCIAAIDPAVSNAKSTPPSVNDLIFSTMSGVHPSRRLLRQLLRMRSEIYFTASNAGTQRERNCAHSGREDFWLGGGLFSLLRPGVMCPCVRRDDSLGGEIPYASPCDFGRRRHRAFCPADESRPYVMVDACKPDHRDGLMKKAKPKTAASKRSKPLARPTIRDVAQSAGVSVGTVSRGLHG